MKPSHAIILAFVLFIGFILTLVYKTFGVKDDLVSENYYDQEIKYQETINQKENSANDSFQVSYVLTNDSVFLDLTKNQALHQVSTVHLELIRPSNAAMDKNFDISLIQGKGGFPKKDIVDGFYKTKITFTLNKTYLLESDLYIN